MTITRPQSRGKLYLRIPGLGKQITLDSLTASLMTSVAEFANSDDGTGQWDGTNIYRPNLTGADRVKPTGVLSGATLGHLSSSNWVDTTDTAVEIVGLITPDELNDCIRRGIARVFFLTWVPLSPWQDGDFSGIELVIGDWTALQSNTFATYSVTAANNGVGYQSLLLTNSGLLGYTYTQNLAVDPGDRLVHGALNRVTVAGKTAVYSLWDVSNNAQIGSSLSHSSQSWQRVLATDTIPAGCYLVRAKLQGAESNAVTVWDALLGHNMTNLNPKAPSWCVEPWNLIDVAETEYERSSASGVWAAGSMRRTSWYDEVDFSLEPRTEDASPRTLQVLREKGMPSSSELWLHGMRPYSDRGAMTAEADDTEAPEELLMQACMAEIYDLAWRRYKEPEYAQLRDLAELKLAAQKQTRRPSRPPRRTTYYTPGGRASGMRRG